MRSATAFLPRVISTLTNFASSTLANFGSGRISRLGTSLRRGMVKPISGPWPRTWNVPVSCPSRLAYPVAQPLRALELQIQAAREALDPARTVERGQVIADRP